MYTWEKQFSKIIKGTETLAFCSESGNVMAGQASHLLGISFMFRGLLCAPGRLFL